MFIVNLCGTDLELPLSDEEMVAIKKEKKIDLFLRREDTTCIKADYRGVDLKEKLPASLWIQEINMLAYVLECMDSEQGQEFLQSIKEIPRMYPGEMLNRALRICPMAAGIPEKSGLIPYYTGENLFQLMAFKRIQDYKRKYPQFQMVKVYAPIKVSLQKKKEAPYQELSKSETLSFAETISSYAKCMDIWSDWSLYIDLLEEQEYLEHGIIYERPDVEIRNNELWAVVILLAQHTFTEEEAMYVRLHLDFDLISCWNECFYEVELPEGHKLCIDVGGCTDMLQQGKGELVLDELELLHLQYQKYEDHIVKKEEFDADFRSDSEYGKTCPVWMELKNDFGKVRIPLPAQQSDVQKSKYLLGNEDEEFLKISIYTPGLSRTDGLCFGRIDLKLFNELAEEVRFMDTETADLLRKIPASGIQRTDQAVAEVIHLLKEIRSGKAGQLLGRRIVSAADELRGPGEAV